jgi:transglutaminase-like putative cysteine protease
MPRPIPFSYALSELPDIARSTERHYPDPGHAVDLWARRFLRKDGPTRTLELLTELTGAIKQDGFEYKSRKEEGVQTPETTLRLKSGSCRDFALLMMEAARALNFAARFVSGYLYVPQLDKSPSPDGTMARGGGATHAWVQVYLPGAGWMEFDPTNAIVGNRDLIRVAVTRDPTQAVPLTGTWMGAAQDFLGLDVDVQVRNLDTAVVPAPPAPVPAPVDPVQAAVPPSA